MYATTIVALLALGGNVHANVLEAALAPRQTSDAETAYLNSVCTPNVTTGVIPPCQEISNIESTCAPNGTAPIDLLAHAECMCGGSYFDDWIGCLDCEYVHGGRSPALTSAFHTILSSASNQLCTGTPTASFGAIFSALQYNVVANGTGTETSDRFPSMTAVSLYYTPSGSQGPGPITGSATAATKTGGVVQTTSGSGSKTSSGSKSSGTAGGVSSQAQGTGGSSSTSSSKAGAAPTGVWMGGLGVMAGVVGMVVL